MEREIGLWLKQQKDYQTVNIYSHNVWIKDFEYIDFYLDSSKKTLDLFTLEPGGDQKMYLVETSGYWSVPDSILRKVEKIYNVEKVLFNGQYNKTARGSILICTKKAP